MIGQSTEYIPQSTTWLVDVAPAWSIHHLIGQRPEYIPQSTI
jgi:hypothetical protein